MVGKDSSEDGQLDWVDRCKRWLFQTIVDEDGLEVSFWQSAKTT